MAIREHGQDDVRWWTSEELAASGRGRSVVGVGQAIANLQRAEDVLDPLGRLVAHRARDVLLVRLLGSDLRPAVQRGVPPD